LVLLSKKQIACSFSTKGQVNLIIGEQRGDEGMGKGGSSMDRGGRGDSMG